MREYAYSNLAITELYVESLELAETEIFDYLDDNDDGEINVNDVLIIKSEGLVSGKIFYGEIQIDEGGKISGEIAHRDKDIKQEVIKIVFYLRNFFKWVISI